jgi:hypothetical protein
LSAAFADKGKEGDFMCAKKSSSREIREMLDIDMVHAKQISINIPGDLNLSGTNITKDLGDLVLDIAYAKTASVHSGFTGNPAEELDRPSRPSHCYGC